MARKPLRLTIFNHKGGVGKTTLTVNIAAALAEQGKHVLLIDSDPQCNLTSYLLPDEDVDKLLDRSEGSEGRTIWSAVRPIADEGRRDVRPLRPLPTVIENVNLIPGDIQMSEFEESLGDSWTACFKRKLAGFREVSAISSLIETIIRRDSYDFVFYDAGPNIGSLNRVLLLDSDFFIVPVACDLFSTRALSTLGQTLKRWILDWRTIQALAPEAVYLLPGTPRLLGYIPQRFKTYGQAMASVPAGFLNHVERRLNVDVMRVLRKLDRSLVHGVVRENRLGQLRDLGSLVQKAQQQGVPLWKVYGGPQYQLDDAEKSLRQIAKKITKRTA